MQFQNLSYIMGLKSRMGNKTQSSTRGWWSNLVPFIYISNSFVCKCQLSDKTKAIQSSLNSFMVINNHGYVFPLKQHIVPKDHKSEEDFKAYCS